MMRDPSSAVDSAQERPIRACRVPDCELAADLRRSLDLLRQENGELQVALAELDRLASTDKLTGAWNRRSLEEAVENEMDRLRRYDHPLCVLILDIDFFKRVNDRFGHAAGDQLLIDVAEQIRSTLRATDSLARWGGEEFAVLCPNTTLATAAILAERLRKRIASTRFPAAEEITVSIGVAECLPGETWAPWFHRADAALYRAKALGRNRVQVAAEMPMRAAPAETVSANFVQLVWHKAYASGDEVVDREHKKLFRDANDLLAAVLSGRPADEIDAAANALLGDMAQHFQDEESIIAAAGYPDAAKHATIHRTLADDAGALIERFRCGKADAGEMFQFLAHDMVAMHLLNADRGFFPYLENRCATTAN